MPTADDRPGSPAWRTAEAERLLSFGARAALDEGGFGYLDDEGEVDQARPRELYITARMTHVFSLASLGGGGLPHLGQLAAHGVNALTGLFHDDDHAGWFHSVGPDGQPQDDAKTNYDHSFVLLAASSALAADVPGASGLLAAAQQVIVDRFWRDSEGSCVESYNRDWSTLEDYRGANSNMHAVEAFMACADVTGELVWRDRALSIAERIIHVATIANGWRMPEHFDSGWNPDLEYNAHQKADPFRPYGSTPGHWLEWARLLIGLDRGSSRSLPWLTHAATRLLEEAEKAGWAADGRPGFVYTLDWQDSVVVDARMHWVIAEAVLAADAVFRATGDRRARDNADLWWREIDARFVDRERGSWIHEVDPNGNQSHVTWSGKPDVYHAYQAVLFPDLPLAPSAAAALRAARIAGAD
jgi:mannose/cellobiose epimerase-like protein (N-acyl-D-glucosamine 2-epimerase family)